MSREGAYDIRVGAVAGGGAAAGMLIVGGALVAARMMEGVGVLGASALQAVGRHAERVDAEQAARSAAAVAWEEAAREAIGRNARIVVLAHHARRHGVVLPAPLCVDDLDVGALRAWCSQADAALERAVKELADREGADLRATVAALLARHGGQSRTVADVVGGRRAPNPHDAALATVLRVIDRLAADAGEADRAAVRRGAEAASRAAASGTGDVAARTLRTLVQGANDRAERMRAEALEAASFLQAIGDGPDGDGTAGALRAVVAREQGLDPSLRERARERCRQVRERSERAYVQQAVVTALAELGYEVDVPFTTGIGVEGRLRVGAADWSEHAVSVAVDDGEVRSAVIRTARGEDARAHALDETREEQWCAALEALPDRLAAAGVEARVTSLVAPGERAMPVAAPSATVDGSASEVAEVAEGAESDGSIVPAARRSRSRERAQARHR